jgi:hypothetical protein
MKRFLLLGVLLAAIFGVGSRLQPASAQQPPDQGFNLVTSPLPISLSGDPGTTLTADIRVKNGGTQTEQLKVGLMKFSAYGEEGKPAIDEREPGDDYFDWVTFSPQQFTAPSNEWKTVKITIKLPQTAAFGYYYAAVFSRAGAQPEQSGKQNVLVGSAAVLVLVEAKSANARRTAKVDNFTVSKRFYEFLPADFSIKIHNGGNIHLVPTGNIFIKRGNSTVATLSINKAAGNVLPNSNRIFTADWSDGFPVYNEKIVNGKTALDKEGKPERSLQWDMQKASKLRFGRYTAHLLMAYDDGTRDVPLEAYVSFWVIPWRVLGVGLLVAIFVGIGLWSVVRSIIKKVRKK